jgi:hypothetical protein
MSRGRREAAVCSLCIAKPRATALGEAIREERVRTAAGAETVRRLTPTPVLTPAGDRRSGRSASLAG